MSNNAWVVIDFETTGLSTRAGDRATEVAAIRFDDTGREEHFSSLMKSGRLIPPFIERYTGISNAMVAEAPPSHEVMHQLAAFVGDLPLVAHNASFDAAFLLHEAQLAGCRIHADFVCSLKLARRLIPASPNYKLATLAQHLNLERAGNFHRALFDAQVTVDLWHYLRQHLSSRYACDPSHELMQAIERLPAARVEAFLQKRAGAGL